MCVLVCVYTDKRVIFQRDDGVTEVGQGWRCEGGGSKKG